MLNKPIKLIAATLALLLAVTCLMPPLQASDAARRTINKAQVNTFLATASNTAVIKFIASLCWEMSNDLYEIGQQSLAGLQILTSWLLPDDSDIAAETQEKFVTYTNANFINEKSRNEQQQKITQALFKDAQGNLTVTKESVPWANDITFQTLMGIPYFPEDPRDEKKDGVVIKTTNAPLNYVENIAGVNIKHIIPNSTWRNSSGLSGAENIGLTNYIAFYKTVASIQTYNAWVLSEMYADYENGGSFSAEQNKLIQQASNSDWFKHVMGDPNIAHILRETLMYISQSLVIQSQLLKTQKQQLAAQAMTNTLLILGNQFNESTLLDKATGRIPS